ncbi:unnamed protein product [Polarella glacialis]|uniref:Uncharacterized protein n=1 Tax=Polarella glacialis TaxID=89957 RepID=A0A813HYR2_POLGL|nr:unnamed protein product [Polarella glacialis]
MKHLIPNTSVAAVAAASYFKSLGHSFSADSVPSNVKSSFRLRVVAVPAQFATEGLKDLVPCTIWTGLEIFDVSTPYDVSAGAGLGVRLGGCLVWLAMHASISSHSYGTRLLTRFVRLPIPGSQQMNALNARFADFERQGVQMLRVPFLDGKANTWQQRAELEQQRAKEVKAAAAGLPSSPAAMASPLRRSSESGPNIIGRRVPEGSGLAPPDSQYLQDAEHAYGGATDMAGREDELLHAVEFRTQRHVQLFRQLQARWQCYDAYARVCMSLGVRHMLQAISYYLIGICMVQNQLPYLAYVLTFTFQALAMTTSVLDIHGLPCYGTLDLSVVGMLPSIILCVSLSIAPRDQEGLLLEDNFYLSSLAAYPLEICWFELLRWVASPTDPGASLPRHFRAVLFMDVFSDVDLVEQENPDGSHLSAQERTQLGRRVATCEGALTTAKAALRRWEAVPNNWLSMKQRRQLGKFQTGFNDALEDLRDELVSRHFRWTFEAVG